MLIILDQYILVLLYWIGVFLYYSIFPPPALPLLSPQVEICEGWYRLSKESEYKDKKIIERQQSSGKERDF